MSGAETFYDKLADDYHLVYADWRHAVRRQGDTLDHLIRSLHAKSTGRVLDASCGIGTQAIGLALHGYAVHASDISARSVDRAKEEAATFGVKIDFNVADMRRLADSVPGIFDVVLSCDNSLPHLVGDADILTALHGMRTKLTSDGIVVIGIRDYDEIVRIRPRVTPPQTIERPDNTALVFQYWDWATDNRTYEMTLFVIKRNGKDWHMTSHTTQYRALLRSELARMLAESGFTDLRWHVPETTGHHQPIVTARV